MFTIGKIIIIIIIVHLGEREGPCVLSTPAKVKPCPLSMGSSRSTPSQATRIGPKFYQHHENLALEISTSLSLESRQKLALFKVTLIATDQYMVAGGIPKCAKPSYAPSEPWPPSSRREVQVVAWCKRGKSSWCVLRHRVIFSFPTISVPTGERGHHFCSSLHYCSLILPKGNL